MAFDAVGLLEQMLRIPSVSGQEQDVAQYLVSQMQGIGLHAYVDGAGNAVGELGHGPEVVLLGHIDTVPGVVPVRVEDGMLYGRGAVDAKGPFATFVSAAARLSQGEPLPYKLVLVGAVEEEAATSKGAHHIVERHRPAACVIGEPSGWDRLTLGYKGRILADARWEQGMAHSAGREAAVTERAVAFWNDVAALCASFNASRQRLFDQLLPSLRAINSGSDGLTDWASVVVGIRLPEDMPPPELAAKLAELAGEGNIHFHDGCHAYQGEKNSPLVRAFLKGVRGAGGTPGFLLKTGTSDMNVVGPVWKCPILAYGPGDSNLDHTPNEHVPIDEYLRAIDVLVAALRQLGTTLA